MRNISRSEEFKEKKMSLRSALKRALLILVMAIFFSSMVAPVSAANYRERSIGKRGRIKQIPGLAVLFITMAVTVAMVAALGSPSAKAAVVGSLAYLPFILLLIASVVVVTSPVNAADTIYTIRGGRDYNGSASGYIMAWDVTGSDYNGTALRVAFSANRPRSMIGKSIGVYIRTDGYYSRDCGWWYTVDGASINVSVYKPGEYDTPNVTLTGVSTDSSGVWENASFLKLTTDYPLGVYRLNATVSKAGLASVGEEAGGNYLTVYVDVGGTVLLTAWVNDTVNKSQNITIKGDITHPNGEPFTYQTDVYAGILGPDESYSNVTTNTSTGSYSMEFNGTMFGHYFIVVTINATIGDDAEATGRAANNSLVIGTWPDPVEASFDGSIFRVMIAVIFALFLFYFPGIKRRIKGGGI